MTVENTSKRDPFTHLIGAMSEGTDSYITGMEAAGQQQVVNSDVLPSDAPWEKLEDLGFVRGEPVQGDDLFVHCTLPAGWKKAGTGHSMHSDVLDERGVKRVGVFYKAAFYDRHAHAHIARPGWQYSTEVLYGDTEPRLPDLWDVLTEDERADFWTGVDDMVKNIADHPSIYSKYEARVNAILAMKSETSSL